MAKPAESKPPESKKPKARKPIRKWLTSAAGAAMLLFSVPVILLLNPSLLYAHSTPHGRFTVYHDTPLDPAFRDRLDAVARHIDRCELADPTLRIDVCLNDGSKYPQLARLLYQRGFAVSIADKMLLRGTTDWADNSATYPGTRWNLEQLMTHEATHCLQLHRFGILDSRPLARHPAWKEEGYAEHVARQNADQADLAANIRRLLEAEEKNGPAGRVAFADGTDVDITYYGYWVLVQYCLDVKKMTYLQLREDSTSQGAVNAEMMRWYQAHAAKK